MVLLRSSAKGDLSEEELYKSVFHEKRVGRKQSRFLTFEQASPSASVPPPPASPSAEDEEDHSVDTAVASMQAQRLFDARYKASRYERASHTQPPLPGACIVRGVHRPSIAPKDK